MVRFTIQPLAHRMTSRVRGEISSRTEALIAASAIGSRRLLPRSIRAKRIWISHHTKRSNSMKKALAVTALLLAPFLAAAACNGLPGGFPGGTFGEVIGAFLPEGISLDVSELPDPYGDATAKTKDAAALGVLSPYQRALHGAARIVHNFHRLADKALLLGARIRHDMTDPSQTQVAGILGGGSHESEHEQLPDGERPPVYYKADFAAFDFDGDGTPDGSGNAVDAPVAMRLWLDRGDGYQRFMCALITVKPAAESPTSRETHDGNGNLGAGALFVRPGAAHPDAHGDLQMYVEWDRTDSAHKWNDAFISGHLREDLALTLGHERVDVRTGADEGVEKTVRSATDFGDNPFGLETLQASVHFKRESGAALISALATGGGGSIAINNQCVTLPEGFLDNTGKCDGFDTQDMGFIDLPVGGETDFPADFPETPTF
jgi:hypothetical protein